MSKNIVSIIPNLLNFLVCFVNGYTLFRWCSTEQQNGYSFIVGWQFLQMSTWYYCLEGFLRSPNPWRARCWGQGPVIQYPLSILLSQFHTLPKDLPLWNLILQWFKVTPLRIIDILSKPSAPPPVKCGKVRVWDLMETNDRRDAQHIKVGPTVSR